MWFSSFYVLFFGFLQSVAGYSHLEHDICANDTQERARGCTTQILGNNNANKNACHVEFYHPNSKECRDMNFSNETYTSNIGGVSLRPYLLAKDKYVTRTTNNLDKAVLNITFSNIKWKTMKFRFQAVIQGDRQNHCRDIILPNNVEINDRSVLYYDCYWPIMDKYNGFSHYLDFEATDGNTQMSRGRYYFNVPSANMLSPSVTEEKWQPFLYIAILTANVKLHIVPPQRNLNITGYLIKVIKEVDKSTHVEKKVDLKNKTQETIFEYSIMNEGPYYFTVIPLHAKCDGNGPSCQSVDSPKIMTKTEVETLNICIASITALIVATLFAYYIALRFIRRYWCKDYSTVALDKELPAPTKVLVIYSPVNRLHAECVLSFVTYLRSEYGFDVMYDGDISTTSHGDPFIWAHEAFKQASHVMYIVGPAEESNYYNNIYDKPIHAYQNVDKLLLALIRPDEVSHSPKDILNVFFEHSTAKLPIETRHKKVFFLLKDWQKLIAYLSKNLLPKKQIMRTEKGKCFLEDLSRAKKLLNSAQDSVDVAIKCEKMNLCDKKVLI